MLTNEEPNNFNLAMSQLVIQVSDLKELITGLKKLMWWTFAFSLITVLAIVSSIAYSFFKG